MGKTTYKIENTNYKISNKTKVPPETKTLPCLDLPPLPNQFYS